MIQLEQMDLDTKTTIYSRNSVHIAWNVKHKWDINAVAASDYQTDGFYSRVETIYFDNSAAPRWFTNYGKSQLYTTHDVGSSQTLADRYLPSIQRQSLYQESYFGENNALRKNEYLLKAMVMCEGNNLNSGVKRLILCESGEGYPLNTTKTTTGLVNIGSIDISHNPRAPSYSTDVSGTHPYKTSVDQQSNPNTNSYDFVFGQRAGFVMKSTNAFTNNGSGANQEWHTGTANPDEARAKASAGQQLHSTDYYYELDAQNAGLSHVQAAILDTSVGDRMLTIFTQKYSTASDVDIHMQQIPVQRDIPTASSQNPNETQSTYTSSGYPTTTDLSSNANDFVTTAVYYNDASRVYVGGFIGGNTASSLPSGNTLPFLYSLKDTATADFRAPFSFKYTIDNNERFYLTGRTNGQSNTTGYNQKYVYSGIYSSVGNDRFKIDIYIIPIFNAFAEDTMVFTKIESTSAGADNTITIEGYAKPDIVNSNDGFIINTNQGFGSSALNGGSDSTVNANVGRLYSINSYCSSNQYKAINFKNIIFKVQKWGNIPFSRGWYADGDTFTVSGGNGNIRTINAVEGIFSRAFQDGIGGYVTGGSEVPSNKRNSDKPFILPNSSWRYAWLNSNPPIEMQYWDVSNIVTMRGAFMNTTEGVVKTANPVSTYLSNWNVSNVYDMSGMFHGATGFNQNISSWNVSDVSNMNDMFNGATTFNNGGTTIMTWNCGNVTTMERMFVGATSFNANIGGWSVNNVLSFKDMFKGVTSFNVGGGSIANWNVKNATNFTSMLQGASVFADGMINLWKVDQTDTITNMIVGTNITGGTLATYTGSAQSIQNNFNYLLFNQTRPVHYVNTDASASNIVDYSVTNGAQTNNSMTFGSDTIIFGKNVTSVNNNQI